MISCESGIVKTEGKETALCAEMTTLLSVFKEALIKRNGEEEGLKLYKKCIEAADITDEQKLAEIEKMKEELLNSFMNLFVQAGKSYGME